MEMYRDSAYPQPVSFKYPKVGEKNALVSAHLYHLKTATLRKVTLPENTGSDFYLPRLQWTPSGKLCLTWMNRLQNHEQLLLADPTTGQCSILFEEKNSRYLDLHDVIFLPDGSGFIKQNTCQVANIVEGRALAHGGAVEQGFDAGLAKKVQHTGS